MRAATHAVACLPMMSLPKHRRSFMARRRYAGHSWTLEPATPLSIANARIALAVMRAVRRLPGALKAYNYDDLGAVMAPVFDAYRAVIRPTVKAHASTVLGEVPFDLSDDAELDSPDLHVRAGMQLW